MLNNSKNLVMFLIALQTNWEETKLPDADNIKYNKGSICSVEAKLYLGNKKNKSQKGPVVWGH